MTIYNDAALNELIRTGKDATIELSMIKAKAKNLRVKELLTYRRSQLNFIRKRLRELNLTEKDFDDIHSYVIEKSFS